ncbi:MAG: hypothetical protein IT320_15655 [Anaerolineae bacterium]|nr:hypothetical protein [Anaerolineae bacterium]
MTSRRFWKRFSLELRFGLTSKLFWVVMALWTVMVVSVTQSMQGITAEIYLTQSFYLTSTVFISICTATLTLMNASRSRRHNFLALELSLPIDFEVPFAQYLGNLTLNLGLLIPPLVAALTLGPLRSFLYGLDTYLATQLISISFVSLLTFWAARRFGARPVSFFLIFGIWMFFASIPNPLRPINTSFPAVTLLSILRVGMDPFWVNDLFGKVSQGALYTWFDLFYVGVTVSLIFLWRQRYSRSQFGVFSRLGWVGLGIGLIVTVGAAGIYLNSFTAHLQAADAYAGALTTANEEDRVSISTYDLAYRSEGEQVFITAEMTIQNVSQGAVDQFLLTLFHTLAVTDANYPIEREGHTLTVRLDAPLAPGDRVTLRLSYEGPLDYWETVIGTVRRPYFVTSDAVYLPYYAMWYPTVGTRMQAHALSDSYATAPIASLPAQHFRLQILDGSLPFASNLPQTDAGVFYGENVTWVSLFGSQRMISPAQAEVTLVTSNVYEQKSAGDLNDIQALHRAYSRYFPEVPVDSVTALMFDEADMASTLCVPESGSIAFLGLPPVQNQVLLVLNPLDALTDAGPVTESAAQFVADSYWSQLGGPLEDCQYEDPTARMEARRAINAFLWRTAHTDEADAALDEAALPPLAQALLTLQREQGDAGVIRVLEQLPQQSDAFFASDDAAAYLEWMRGD